MQVPLFLVVLHRIRICISRYHFQQSLKKDFRHQFSFWTDSPKATTLLLSVTKVFRWCFLNLENFWFYIWVVVLWLNFTTQMTLHHLLLMRPWIEYLSAKTTKYILKFLERYVKRKSDISFRVIKNSSFDQRFLMVKTFLKILCQRLWWRFLVPHSEHFLVYCVWHKIFWFCQC